MGFQTDCTATGEDRQRYHGSIPPPIYESSTFVFPNFADFEAAAQHPGGRPIYTRGSNPTVQVLQEKLALLERAEAAQVFASGMAAISAAVLSVVRSGDHLIAPRGVYANSHRLFHEYLPSYGIETTFADLTDLDAIEAAIRPTSRLLYLESPTNPTMALSDLIQVAALARRHDLVTVIDNSLATPYNQRPLEAGIDLVVHSASKYLSGHSDIVAGVVAGSQARLEAISARQIRDLGGILGPFEAWLMLRGLRTLGLRMAAHNAAGMRVARWLEGRPEVECVLYPGLPSHPQAALARRQMRGASSLMGMVVRGGRPAAIRLADGLQYFGIGVSWGGFESLVLPTDPLPGMTAAERAALDPDQGFVRLYVGLEDVEDLLADLDQALAGAVA